MRIFAEPNNLKLSYMEKYILKVKT